MRRDRRLAMDYEKAPYLSVGVDARLEEAKLELEDVEAQALLKV